MRHHTCSLETVQTLVLCGYNVIDDQWLQKNENLAETLSDKHIVHWLRVKQETIPQLAELCRNVIRREITCNNNDCTLLDSVQELPIPPLLKDFVSMTDLLRI